MSSSSLIAVSLGSAEEDARAGAALASLLGPDVRVATSTDESLRAGVRFVGPAAFAARESGTDLVVNGDGLLGIAALLERPGLSHVVSPSLLAGRGTGLVPRVIRHLMLGGRGPAALVEGVTFPLRAVAQRDEVLDAVAAAAGRFGAPDDRRLAIRATIAELVDNALAVLFGERAVGLADIPPEERMARVVVGSIGATFLVSVTDRCGGFERANLIDALRRGAERERTGGEGGGLWRVARAAQHLLVRVEPGEATEVIAGFDLTTPASTPLRSLHLFVEPRREATVTPAARVEAGATPQMLEGRYELLDLISSGGMGSVYRARHVHLDRLVAVKVIRNELRDDPAQRQHFFAEARVASSLVHPHIVGVTDFGIDPTLGYFLVMELLHGDTLRARIADQPVRARVACDVLEQVAWALRYIHAHGIVHCDLKPDNIFLATLDDEPRRRNNVRLIDFGLAFRMTDRASNMGGTPPYLAPERLTGAPPSVQGDIYSLGTIFYELVTGQLPYEGSLTEIMQQQLRGVIPPRPSTISPEMLEPRADELIMRALSPDPRVRQANAEAFLYELRTLMSMMGMRVRRVVRAAGGAGTGARLTARREPTIATAPRRLRAHPRLSLRVPVSIRDASTSYRGVTENVSKGGLLVNVGVVLPLGTELDVSLPDPRGGTPAQARAVVRWSREDAGCGLAWVDPPSTLWPEIERLRRSARAGAG